MTRPCPSCGEQLADAAAFCEACGAQVGAADADLAGGPGGVKPPVVAGEAAPFDATFPTRIAGSARAPSGPRPCLACGGVVGPDGYCDSCGTKQPDERDHFREQPAPWVAGVCDRGLVHARNEDALALHAGDTAAGPRAVLVVLDGVSNTDDSHLASLAGARAARDVLRATLPAGLGTAQSRTAAAARLFQQAVDAAQAAIVDLTPDGSEHPPSATFAAAVLEGGRLVVGNIGDSRVYWLPDAGTPSQLSVDDSVAQLQIEAGMTRREAEEGPQGHAITRWLGVDAPDLEPRLCELDLDRPGWLLACSDGLWNYLSEPAALAERLRLAAADAGADPMAVALALVAHANASGGHDNITVALARVSPPPGHNAPDHARGPERESDG
ncbi:hypothetical protein GCM10023340_28180 [Nocardioides marinquilinus]|uniref:PPM-type phosphatase domain-containing protein n=1 Tax=Nocardioides marinquilinus TaxID=1210400 RepID=A0ABP9PQQ9_9ACTN